MDELLYQFHHVFLPPKAPQEKDVDRCMEQTLAGRVLSALTSIGEAHYPIPEPVQANIKMLRQMLELEKLDHDPFCRLLATQIDSLEENECILLHLRAQNAGLLVTALSETFMFEPFELLAANKDVASCPSGRLIRHFPGPAVAINRTRVLAPNFLSELAHVLDCLNREASPVAQAKSKKAKRRIAEERETTSPILVTNMLLSTLRGIGKDVSPAQICKHSREQVNWSDSRAPWHRSAGWLLLRVGLRLVFDRVAVASSAEGSAESSLYKPFMAYLMATILGRAVDVGMSNDMLYIMSAKISRRLQKLNPTGEEPWLKNITENMQKAGKFMETRWKGIQEAGKAVSKLDFSPLQSLQFDPDSALVIRGLREFLDWAETREAPVRNQVGPGDWTRLRRVPDDQLPTWSQYRSTNLPAFKLIDIESWVAQYLPGWLEERESISSGAETTQDMQQFAKIIDDYCEVAPHQYSGNAESLSVMYLTVMELWVALDRLACAGIPLLSQFGHGFPPDLLHTLLLPTKGQMVRLQKLERYLELRRFGKNQLPFENFGHAGSFAVQYFNQSPHLQRLRDNINAHAKTLRAKKIVELHSIKKKYADLTQKIAQTAHQKMYDTNLERRVCMRNCPVCGWEKEKENLYISVFEWPLPVGILEEKAAVFEINVPESVAIWRETTLKLLTGVFGSGRPDSEKEKLWYLSNFLGLKDYETRTARACPASTVKPFTVAHYSSQKITMATEQSICVPHGSQYEYYDSRSNRLIDDAIMDPALPENCSLAVAVKPRVLQNWVVSPEHTSNQVIAKQSECPADMRLDAFRAFGHLRSGVRIQWINILHQLLTPAVNWDTADVSLLIIQAAEEASPPDDDDSPFRQAHDVTQLEPFLEAMGNAMRMMLGRIEESWEHGVTLAGLVVLCMRLQSLTPNKSTRSRFSELAAQLRKVSYTWSQTLLAKLSRSVSNKDIAEWTDRSFFSLLTCIVTFDMESEEDLLAVLQSEDEAAIFLEASLHAHELEPATGPPTDTLTLFLFQRWQRIAYRAEKILEWEIKQEGSRCLDYAVQKVWCDCPDKNEWHAGVDQQEHVVITTVSPAGGNPKMYVSLNLLTGSLLVNGFPLTKLPPEYRQYEEYNKLFGKQNLDVIPSMAKGVQFAVTTPYEGYDVKIGMIDTKLIVRAMRDGKTLEYIPCENLIGDLPESFIKDYSHWVDIDTGEIEFRPVDTPWKSAPENWKIVVKDGQYFLIHGSQYLIEPSSTTGTALEKLLRNMEVIAHVHIIYEPDMKRLEIKLPRVGIDFYLTQGQTTVASKQYEGMCIDEDQEFGSLVGLQNKLVLRPTSNRYGITSCRRLIVPQGIISYESTEQHVSVSIENKPSLFYHDYIIDDKLGRLADSGTLHSKLVLCYLHALTSHCLPDPLTGRTGTEESLRILRSGSVLSFERLDAACANLLSSISGLSPQRKYYPEHLMSMEQTRWSKKLPSLSQHEKFARVVQEISNHAMDCELFFDEKMPMHITSMTKRDDKSVLSTRALFRNAIFRVSEYGAECYSSAKERIYNGRGTMDVKTEHAYLSAVSLMRESTVLPRASTERLKGQLMSFLGDNITGPLVALGEGTLRTQFDMVWLQKPGSLYPRYWCKLNESLAKAVLSRDRYRLMFFFSGMAFAEDANWDAILLLLARVLSPSVRSVAVPSEPCFLLKYGFEPNRLTIGKAVEPAMASFNACPESWATGNRDARYTSWRQTSQRHMDEFVNRIMALWPQKHFSELPIYTDGLFHIDMTEVNISAIATQFLEISRNYELDIFIDDLINEFDPVATKPASVPPYSKDQLLLQTPPATSTFVAHGSLYNRVHPVLFQPSAPDFSSWYENDPSPARASRLPQLLEGLHTLARHQHEQEYIGELHQSFAAYQASGGQAALNCSRLCGGEEARRAAFEKHLHDCRETVTLMEQCIQDALGPVSAAERAARSVAAWPRVSRVFLLQRLSRNHWSGLSAEWQQCLTAFAVALTYLQQAERLLDERSQPTDLVRELTSAVHTWDPQQQPESLLLEVEQGLLIRQVQDEVATQMRDPPKDGAGSVMQLNMGEGKSSVIVPVVAAALADGQRLMRIVVGKAQSKQMAHLLVSRLGGLLNRRIFFLPFSRSLRLNNAGAQLIQRMMRTCQTEGGVLLVQPEHLLSFQLMGLEYQRETNLETGQAILQIHNEWGRVARDMVDESDDNFSVRFELIYTMGSQQPVDFHADRWSIIQQVLDRTASLARKNRIAYGAGLQLDERPRDDGSYPLVRVLDADTGRRLVHAVAQNVCTRGLRGFPILQQPLRVREAVLRYIRDVDVQDEDVYLVQKSPNAFATGVATKPLLLLRGLFARGILAFALGQKRYRVHYGLAPLRKPSTRLAVPFRAKDAPAPRSEFSHPDVVIVLTCLSYYYRGLNDDELTVCFERLAQLDRAEQEYDSWVRQSPQLSASSSFRSYASVNIRDRRQCVEQIFPALRRVKAVVDFYLAHVVFPAEMREFPKKLSASGWDLAKRKTLPLTGFSGTNDSKYVLPLSVKSRDLPEQQHTNAAVLDCLLGGENCVEEVDASLEQPQQDILTTDALLACVTTSTPPIQVILDVGAQIIELDNQQMARQWLEHTPVGKADAVIFFDDHDNLLVLTRSGVAQKFLTSPFANRTDRCLVFLDQAHTRGTDLRLPDHYRAAVTLGPKITKDTLVQACMRMRKLGRGQSVVFCVSPEMQHAIRALHCLSADQPLVVADVLAWSIVETWDETFRSLPLWATQGLRHHRQSRIWDRVATPDGPRFQPADIDDYLEDEAQTLETRYLPGGELVPVADMVQHTRGKGARCKDADLVSIQHKCASFGITSLGSAALQEEQERELANEIEEEREVQRPPPATALKHTLYPAVEHFVAFGTTATQLPAGLFPAFAALHGTKAASMSVMAHTQFSTSPELLATADFAQTVKRSLLCFCADAYQRPVQWILAGHPEGMQSRSPPQQLLIISPWEANKLLPRIRTSGRVSLHLYSPRMSLSLPSLETLQAFALPSVAPDWAVPQPLITQLNLFAGQMYLASYAEYSRLCGFLGVSMHENTSDEALPGDGFVGRQTWNPECPFTVSPVGFLNELYKRIRGDCLEITETHMGRVLSGEILSKEDFEGQ